MLWKIRVILFLIAVSVAPAKGAVLTFHNAGERAIDVPMNASTGLTQLYVLADAQGAAASIDLPNAQCWKFGEAGAAFAEEWPIVSDGSASTWQLAPGDAGYMIDDGNRRYFYWIIDYSQHQCQLDGIEIDAEADCDRTRLHLIGNAADIKYYTINGAPQVLSRQLTLSYTTLAYDSNARIFAETPVQTQLDGIDGTFGAVAPLCDTQFHLSGDRFLEAWGREQSCSSEWMAAYAIAAQTWAEQEEHDYANEQKNDGNVLGGSAPATIQFGAALTDKAIFHEWEISTNPDFDTVINRYQDVDFEYTFRQQGTYYVRLVANNEQGSCEYIGETYEVAIGESVLLCPNAFSPQTSPGVNDEWRVSYKSIIEFECHIFNRWGQQMATLTHPSQGWDGRYKGKYVAPGAYYYVIKAVGSDGKRYNLSGDINIINAKENQQYNTE